MRIFMYFKSKLYMEFNSMCDVFIQIRSKRLH